MDVDEDVEDRLLLILEFLECDGVRLRFRDRTRLNEQRIVEISVVVLFIFAFVIPSI